MKRDIKRARVEFLEGRTLLAQVAFGPVTLLPAGTYPTGLATADLSRKGRQDIVETNYGSGTVGILVGRGDGTFNPVVTYPVGNGPTAVAIGDLNGDGIPDLAVTNSGQNTLDAQNTHANSVSLLLGNGDGTFHDGGTLIVGTGPDAVVLADLHGTGHLDIAATNLLSNTVTVIAGNGDGTFGASAEYETGNRPQGLAAADFNRDGHLDLVTANSQSNSVAVLLNRGDGTFKPRAIYLVGAYPRSVIATSLRPNGSINIISTNLQDNTFSVLHGSSKGTFNNQSVYVSGVNPFGVAAGDLNANRTIDLVTADGNGTVSVRQRTNGGYTLDRQAFATGQGPQNVAIADFNGDGKPDLVTSNFADGTVGVLLNITPRPGEKKTYTRLAVTPNPARLGQPVALSAFVRSDMGTPGGDVVFYDSGTAIGAVPLGTNRTATFTTSNLSSGVHTLMAQFIGGNGFGESVSKPTSQVVTTRAASGPDLVGAFDATGLPAQFVPGETVSATFGITNQGDVRAKGQIGSNLFLSTDGTLANAVQVPVSGTLESSKIKLKPGQSTSVSGTFVVPGTLSPGTYSVLADINSANTLAETDTSNNLAASPATFQAVYRFGVVGGISNVTLTLSGPNGLPVTFRLAGPGSADVTSTAAGLDVHVAGTTLASTLTIANPTGLRSAVVNSLTVDGALATLAAPTINFTGPINLTGGASTVAANNLSGLSGATSGLNIGGRSVKSITLGSVAHASLSTYGSIGSVTAVTWLNSADDRITAGSIRSLTSPGTFGPAIQLTGATTRRGPLLKSMTVGAYTGSLSAAGIVQHFVDQGAFAGVLAATRFGSIVIKGSMTGDILGGANLGNDAVLGGGDDTFGAGMIQSLRVAQSTTEAIVAAGLDPVDSTLLNGNDTLIPGGRINFITLGPTDAASRFLAAKLPARVTVAGRTENPSNDPRFRL